MKPVRLILLPALDGTGVFFEPLVRQLPEWIEPKVVSYPQTGGNSYADLYPLVDRVVRESESCFVLGWSFSGPLALKLAVTHPTRVRGVILCASFVTPPIGWLSRVPFLISGTTVGLFRSLWRLRFLLRGYGTDSFRRAKAISWRSVSSRTLAIRGRAIMGCDARAILQECECEILYLAGTHDRVVGQRSVTEVIERARSARVHRINGDHYALFTNPESAVDGLMDFVRTV